MAKLYFRYGAMGSSKTANAIMVQYNYQERGQKALMVKPCLDTRDGERVVASRSGLSAPCIYMEELDRVNLHDYACIIVDENGHIAFTEKGRAIAEKIYERHQVLTEILTAIGVEREIAVRDACKIEHDLSDETFAAMKRHLRDKGRGGTA